MAHWRTMLEGKYLAHYHLETDDGQTPDVVVTIDRCEAGEVIGDGGRKSRKPLLYFVGKTLPLVVNATIGKTIQGMYGAETRGWHGKRIAIYSTTTERAGETLRCIRVRPQIPNDTGAGRKPLAPAKPREPGED